MVGYCAATGGGQSCSPQDRTSTAQSLGCRLIRRLNSPVNATRSWRALALTKRVKIRRSWIRRLHCRTVAAGVGSGCGCHCLLRAACHALARASACCAVWDARKSSWCSSLSPARSSCMVVMASRWSTLPSCKDEPSRSIAPASSPVPFDQCQADVMGAWSDAAMGARCWFPQPIRSH